MLRHETGPPDTTPFCVIVKTSLEKQPGGISGLAAPGILRHRCLWRTCMTDTAAVTMDIFLTFHL